MASVNLDFLYLHRADDESIFLALDLAEEVATPQKQGEVRRLASGRRRAVLRPGSDHPVDISLDLVSRADRETLVDWIETGTLLILREPRGRVLWGHIFEAPVEESALTEDALSISFTFQPITHSEEV